MSRLNSSSRKTYRPLHFSCTDPYDNMCNCRTIGMKLDEASTRL